MTTKIEGQLEIDHDRGVIYFHNHLGYTILRICGLTKPIPKPPKKKIYTTGSHKYWDYEIPYQLDYTFTS